MNKHLRFENYDDETIDKTYKAWKVKEIIELFRNRCIDMLPCPGMRI